MMRNNDRLVLDEYVDECDDLGIGETRRFDHDDNEGCGDTRGRLYITRSVMDPDTLLGFCQNCQKGNAIGLFNGYREEVDHVCRDYMSGLSNNAGSALDHDEAFFYHEEMDDCQAVLNDWPMHARAWCYKRGVQHGLVSTLRWFYEPSLDRIVQPVFKEVYFNQKGEAVHSDFLGEQARLLRGKGPKYMTSKINKDTELHSVLVNPSQRSNLVIVEDMQSAYHVWKYSKYNSLCNFGVQVRPNVLHSVIQKYKPQNIAVWLDNDNDIVREQAENMQRTASMLAPSGTQVRLVTEESDPKGVGLPRLDEVLRHG